MVQVTFNRRFRMTASPGCAPDRIAIATWNECRSVIVASLDEGGNVVLTRPRGEKLEDGNRA
jgi:hypothetical protein